MSKGKAKSLTRIYTAKQCTDHSDCRIALEQCGELMEVYGRWPALDRRIADLKFKRDVILKR